jgi:hypothetical protein
LSRQIDLDLVDVTETSAIYGHVALDVIPDSNEFRLSIEFTHSKLFAATTDQFDVLDDEAVPEIRPNRSMVPLSPPDFPKMSTKELYVILLMYLKVWNYVTRFRDFELGRIVVGVESDLKESFISRMKALNPVNSVQSLLLPK